MSLIVEDGVIMYNDLIEYDVDELIRSETITDYNNIKRDVYYLEQFFNDFSKNVYKQNEPLKEIEHSVTKVEEETNITQKELEISQNIETKNDTYSLVLGGLIGGGTGGGLGLLITTSTPIGAIIGIFLGSGLGGFSGKIFNWLSKK
jgi:hypothetical protein